MSAVTIDPSDEACQFIVQRINSSILYALPRPAAYVTEIIDSQESVDGLRVDVTAEDESQLQETLALEDGSSQILRVWVRDKLPDINPATVAPRKLLLRQIFQRVNMHRSADGRLQVWDCGKDSNESPGKEWVVKNGMFVGHFQFRVEVAPP